MKRLALWKTSVAAGCMAVSCMVSTTGCVSGFGWPSRSGSQAKLDEQLDTQLSLARLSERHGQHDQARNIYNSVLKKAPSNQMAHHRLGVMAARESKTSEAEAHFRRAAEAAPPTAELLNDMAYNLYLQDRLTEAEQVLRQSLERDPQLKRAHNNLGLVLGEQGRTDESLKEFKLAVSEAEAHSNLAYARSQAGDVRAAEQHFHRALALDTSLRPTAEALLDLAKMRTSLENAHPGRAQIADNGGAQQHAAQSVAYEQAAAPRFDANRESGNRITDQRMAERQYNSDQFAGQQFAGREPTHRQPNGASAPVEAAAQKPIDWRNPIASATPESAYSADGGAAPNAWNMHYGPSVATSPSRNSSDLQVSPEANVQADVSSEAPRRSLLARAIDSVRQSTGAMTNRDQEEAAPATATIGKTPAGAAPGAASYRVAFSSDEAAARETPDTAFPVFRGNPPARSKVSVSLSDGDKAGKNAGTRDIRLTGGAPAEQAAPATNNPYRYNATEESSRNVDRIPALSPKTSARRVSFDKIPTDGPLNSQSHLPQSQSDDEQPTMSSPASAASTIHGNTSPWQRPTWTPQSAAAVAHPMHQATSRNEADDNNNTSPATLTTPAKTITNPYMMMPQR